MSAPLLILTLGGALALAAFVWRGRSLAISVAAGGAALIGAVAVGAILGEPFEVLGVGFRLETSWSVLGRSLVLEGGNRVAVGFVFVSGALMMGWIGLAQAPRRTAAVGLLVLASLAAALMVRPFVFAPTFLAGAAIIGSFALVRPTGGGGRAPSRLLITYILGMMSILVAGWLIEVGGVTASTQAPARTAAVLLALGLAILVGTPPFHTWLTAASEESHPMAMVLLATLLQNSGLFFLLSLLGSYAWMRADPLVFDFLRAAGLVMVVVGGLWSLGEKRSPRLVAYALLVDFGVALLAVGTGTVGGAGLALGMAAARTLGAAMWGAGFSAMGPMAAATEPSGDVVPQVPRAARAAAVLGALSLAGAPMTAGFPARWILLQSHGIDALEAGAILLGLAACVGASLGWARGIWDRPVTSAGPWGWGGRAALWGGVVLLVALGLFPDLIYAWVPAGLGELSGLLPAAGP